MLKYKFIGLLILSILISPQILMVETSADPLDTPINTRDSHDPLTQHIISKYPNITPIEIQCLLDMLSDQLTSTNYNNTTNQTNYMQSTYYRTYLAYICDDNNTRPCPGLNLNAHELYNQNSSYRVFIDSMEKIINSFNGMSNVEKREFLKHKDPDLYYISDFFLVNSGTNKAKLVYCLNNTKEPMANLQQDLGDLQHSNLLKIKDKTNDAINKYASDLYEAELDYDLYHQDDPDLGADLWGIIDNKTAYNHMTRNQLSRLNESLHDQESLLIGVEGSLYAAMTAFNVVCDIVIPTVCETLAVSIAFAAGDPFTMIFIVPLAIAFAIITILGCLLAGAISQVFQPFIDTIQDTVSNTIECIVIIETLLNNI